MFQFTTNLGLNMIITTCPGNNKDLCMLPDMSSRFYMLNCRCVGRGIKKKKQNYTETIHAI